MSNAGLLVAALRDPQTVLALDAGGWTALLAMARAELLLASLAHRLEGLSLPGAAATILADARAAAAEQRRQALWEAEMARRALAPLGVPVILLKGTAFVAAGLSAGRGRSIGDLDILVPRDALSAVEGALLAHGWEWVKPDPYDDAYYRRWMHELPPMIHVSRDRMIDVHHTILPLTARPRPRADLMIADAVSLRDGLHILSRADMIIHASAHLFADGDLSGGLRNLWDIDRLIRDFSEDQPDFCLAMVERAREHGLSACVGRALRLANQIYGSPGVGEALPIGIDLNERPSDRLFRRRLLARDGWGAPIRPASRLAFYVRSHWFRMPPGMLARHLWIKWRRGGARAG